MDCKLGEWSSWGRCQCEGGRTCGKCSKKRVQEVVQNCANGGNCDCMRSEETADCSIPCREMIFIESIFIAVPLF